MRNILYTLLLFVFCGCSTSNKFYIEEIQASNPILTSQIYQFPLLNGKNKLVTKKVNSEIILDYLELDFEKKHQSIFENVWATKKEPIPKLSDLTYKINTLNNVLYSVTLNAEGCGAYCEYFSYTYNYDLIKGEIILLDDLFTSDGKTKLLKILKSRKKNIIESELEFLKNESATENSEAINLLERCLKNARFESFEDINFQIKNREIILYSDRCSNHVNRAIDNIGEFEFIFTKKDLSSLMNEYGEIITQK